MALVMNATCETQTVRIFGNYFTLKPKQIKNFSENIAHALVVDKFQYGFVDLPEQFEDPEFIKTEDGQRILREKEAEGIAKRIQFLKSIVYNNQVSLRMDLERANIKVDPRVFATDGEVAAMEELAKYQDSEEDKARAKVARIKELEAKLSKSEK